MTINDNKTPLELLAECALALHDCDESPDDQPDHLDFATAIQNFLSPSQFLDFCAMTELCAIHICDAAICADDSDPECAHLRN